MSNLHVQQGKVMPYPNSTGSTIAVNTVVEFADMIGVALADIPDGETGQLAVAEVFELAKETPLVITQGDQLYWDATNDNVDKTNTNIPCGKAFADAASAATTVQVLLNV